MLKRFSLGVPTWVPFSSSEQDEYYYHEDIGYAKIGGKWGIAIRTVQGNFQDPHDAIDQWLFNDSPRLLRVQAVGKVPELLEALLKKAAEMTTTIIETAVEVDAITAGINSVIGLPPKPKAAKR